jgi:small basic protein
VVNRLLIAAVALAVGVGAGLVLRPGVPGWLDPYLPVLVIAALDAVAGGARAGLERTFSERVFVIAFLGNALVGVLLVLIGDGLGVGGALTTAVVVVFGIRIFTNAAAIRRLVFKA